MVTQVDKYGKKPTIMLVIGKHRFQTQIFILQSSEMAFGPIRDFDRIQDNIRRVENRITQTGKKAYRPRTIRTARRDWQEWDDDQEEEYHNDDEYIEEDYNEESDARC